MEEHVFKLTLITEGSTHRN